MLLGWPFVFGIIMKRDGREPTSSDAITTLATIKLLLFYVFWDSIKWVIPRTSLIGRPARGYSVSPPCHLTIVHSPPSFRASWVWLSSCLSLVCLQFFDVIRTTVHLRLLSLHRAVRLILTYVFWCVFFVLPACTRIWSPLLTFRIWGVGFFRATVFRVSCTLHTDLPCDPCCRASFNYPLGPCFSLPVLPFSYRFAPSRPTPSFRTAILRL